MLNKSIKNADLLLRGLDPCDIDELYKWRNHPDARKNFFNPNLVSWDEHKRWFEIKMEDASVTIYMAYHGESKIGSIRFENKGDAINIGVVLNPEFMGKGFGSEVIRLGTKKFISENGHGKPLVAEIKKDNIASIRAFEKAGFKESHLTFIYEE